MKKITFLLLMLTGFLKATAGGEQYQKSMAAAVATLDTARTPATFRQLANKFERIAGAEKSEWLPYYYAAYCTALVGFMDQDKSKLDEYLNKADIMVAKADSLSPNNSEVMTVRGLVNQSRIMVDPMTRGRKYGPIAGQYLEKAKQMDPSNPRPYYLSGQSLLYTPEMFGGGKAKARPVLEEAVKKYETFKPATDIAPHWGKTQAQGLLEQCK